MARLNVSVSDDILSKIKFLRGIRSQNISKICRRAISAAYTKQAEIEKLGSEKWLELRRKKNNLMTREELVLRLRRSGKISELNKEYGV